MIQLQVPTEYLVVFFLVLARVGGLMLWTPFLGSGATPPLIRVGLALFLSLLILPVVEERLLQLGLQGPVLILALAGELLIGLIMGLVGQLFLAALEMGGQFMGFQMGFGIINVIDPQTQVESSVMSIFQGLLGVMVFLAIDAHHWFLQAIFSSYDVVLPLQLHLNGSLARHLIELSSQIFRVGFQLAAPVVVSVLVVDVLLGIIGRAAPQIHVLIVGLPVKTLIGFVFFLASLLALVPQMARFLSALQRHLYELLALVGG